MKPFAVGAIALVIWTALAFVAGRYTVPDRTQEVKDWRDSAAVALERSEAADSGRVAAEARTGALIERVLVAESRFTQATARSAAASAEVAALTQELVEAATLADTARVRGVIIERQQTQILDLNASLGDAQEIVRDLRMDLQMVQEERAADQAELRELRATIAQGLEATKPSRGRSLGALDCVVGPGVHRDGLDWASASCGLSVRSILGRRG